MSNVGASVSLVLSFEMIISSVISIETHLLSQAQARRLRQKLNIHRHFVVRSTSEMLPPKEVVISKPKVISELNDFKSPVVVFCYCNGKQGLL